MTATLTAHDSTTPAVEPKRTTLWKRLQDYGRPPRLMGIDVARSLAIFGMIGAHVGMVKFLQWDDPSTWSGVVGGRSSILFALVAGISVALASGGRERPEGEELRRQRLRMAGRALAVLAIGLALELTGSMIMVILPIYGILFLIIIPFLGLRRRTLLITAVSIAVLGPALLQLIKALALGTSGEGATFLLFGSYPLAVWLPLMLAGIVLGRSNLASARTAVAVLGTGLLLCIGGYTVGNLVNGAIGGQTQGIGSSSSSFAGSGAQGGGSSGSVGASMGGASGSKATTPGSEVDLSNQMCTTSSGQFTICMPADQAGSGMGGASMGVDGQSYPDALAASNHLSSVLSTALGVGDHSGGTFEIIGSGGFALAIVGLCLLLVRPLRWALIPLAAVGSMPLTAYAGHVLSCAILLSPLALAPQLGGSSQVLGGNAFWLLSIGGLLVACTWWALFFGRGPLERITAWAGRRVDAAPNAPGSQGTTPEQEVTRDSAR